MCLGGRALRRPVTSRTAYGPNAGRRVTRVGDQIDPERMEIALSPWCASVDGFSLHANVTVHAEDRPRLERLARYCTRPPNALERLETLDDGQLLHRFKRACRDGTTHIVMDPLELLEKLSALVLLEILAFLSLPDAAATYKKYLLQPGY